MATDLLTDLRSMFPWVDQIGLTPEFFQQLAAESANSDEIVTKLRQQPQYKARFAGMWRPDGSMRMNEAQYLTTEKSLQTVLRQHGYGDQYTTPQSLVGFFDGEIDPNELNDRLSTWKQIQDSSAHVKDAFYVYAGLNVTDDDLYQATVDPAAAQRLSESYNARVAAQTFDYQTWITRATERGLQRVSETLTQLQKAGALTGDAVQGVLRTDPNFARTVMDALYTNAGQAATQPLDLQSLVSAFEYAAIGGAATGAGLGLPTKEKIAQIRAMGVDRAKATSGYSQYSQMAGSIDDAVRRATGGRFGQADFENAQFLGQAAAQAALSAGLSNEAAAGKQQGQFRFEVGKTGRLLQQGMRSA